MKRETQLNVVVKLTRGDGWRTDWDIEFKDGAPYAVTLSQTRPDGTVVARPLGAGPVRLRADEFFAAFDREWGAGVKGNGV